jgi:phosphoglycolate phosphatase
MKNIRNLLFDLDGTLVDSSLTISACIDYALDRLEILNAGNSPVTSVIGTPLLDIFRKHYEMTDEQAEAAIAHYREHYDRLAQAGSQVYDGVPEVLSTLRNEGFLLFIATVKPTSIAKKVLSDLDLRCYFDGIAGASMSHERRDKASIIAYALQKFDLDPMQSLMIGDRDQDIIGARENGLPSIAVTYGFGTRDELDSARPDHLAGHSEEIVSFLLNPSHPE